MKVQLWEVTWNRDTVKTVRLMCCFGALNPSTCPLFSEVPFQESCEHKRTGVKWEDEVPATSSQAQCPSCKCKVLSSRLCWLPGPRPDRPVGPSYSCSLKSIVARLGNIPVSLMDEMLENCVCGWANSSRQGLRCPWYPHHRVTGSRDAFWCWTWPCTVPAFRGFVLVATSVIAITAVNCERLSCPSMRLCELTGILFTSVASTWHKGKIL